jgi:hypothetical protein
MTDTKMEVSSDRLLKGKANFVTWKREFERAAKAQDVLDLLTGDEDILSKPKSESYLITVPRSSARVAAKQLATPSADNENTDTEITQSANAANNTLRWQMDYKARKIGVHSMGVPFIGVPLMGVPLIGVPLIGVPLIGVTKAQKPFIEVG